MTGWQASARGGVVRVRVEGERVLLGGRAVTVARGELLERQERKLFGCENRPQDIGNRYDSDERLATDGEAGARGEP
jgi:hypothetical protein